MKIVIANGMHSADYIIHKYHNRYNDLIVINNREEACRYLSMNNDIPVMYGQATRESDLREVGAENAELFIALSKNDMENYVACQTAKKLLNVKRCISTVTNPKNVDIFKELGIDSVLSSTYILGEQIRNAASIENLINSLSLEDEKIIIVELKITDKLRVEGICLKDIGISDIGSISVIIRGQKSIIPNGNTQLMADDKVLLVTNEENREAVLKVFKRKK